MSSCSDGTKQNEAQKMITIIGNGAIGNLLALKCHSNEVAYQLLTKQGQPLELTAGDLANQSYHMTPKVVSYEQQIPAGIVIVPLKAYQVLKAIGQLRPQLNKTHTLVLLHNGMGTLDESKALLGDLPLVAATTSYGALKSGPDKLRETGKGQTHAGWITPGNNNQEQAVKQLMNTLIPPCSWHQDVVGALWNKLAINAVINPLTAIHDVNNGCLAKQEFASQVSDLCAETSNIMCAEGYPVTQQELEELCYQVITNTAANFSSMHQDITHRRPTEVDFISGYIVRRAKKYALSATNHQAMLDAIKAMECQ